MKVLAFETSCDETGVALVEGQKTTEGWGFTTLKAALLSQAALHAEYGGVYPTLAQGVKRACDQYYRQKLFSGWFPKIAKRLISFS